MSWINTISIDNAEGILKKIYKRVQGPNGKVDNVLQIHSLRPHTLRGHMTLYKAVLHNNNNTLPKWFLEAIGVYVSLLNECSYCVTHHQTGLRRLINNDDQADRCCSAILSNNLSNYFDQQQLLGLKYARLLTTSLDSITSEGIDALRTAGYNDGEILEINQVACYFNYVNRMVVGLGVNIEGDTIGLSPIDDDRPDNWGHK